MFCSFYKINIFAQNSCELTNFYNSYTCHYTFLFVVKIRYTPVYKVSVCDFIQMKITEKILTDLCIGIHIYCI